jgi:glutamate synthase domain-containing protein 2
VRSTSSATSTLPSRSASGAAPTIFRDNISVPTIPALTRARRHLDSAHAHHVTLAVTGGIRTPADMVKALALGADAIALSNAALQAIGCVGMRACNTNTCPAGIATQDPRLRARLPVQAAADRLHRFLRTAVNLMVVLARACGHRRLADFELDDLVTFDRDFAYLSGVPYAGATPL